MKIDDKQMDERLLYQKQQLEQIKKSYYKSKQSSSYVPPNEYESENSEITKKTQNQSQMLMEELIQGQQDHPTKQEMDPKVQEQYMEKIKKLNQLKKRLAETFQTFKEDSENPFQLDNPDPIEIQAIVSMWSTRNRRSKTFLLSLRIKNCSIKEEVLKKCFAQFPSIKLYVDNQLIDIPGGILKKQGDVFYEGTQKFMSIHYESRKIQYQGQVLNEQPHGIGKQYYNLHAKDGYIYDGQFYHGKKKGKGQLQTNQGILYAGDFQDDLRQGKGVEKVYGNRKKKSKPNEKAEPKAKSTYNGEFKKGFREGQGVQVTSHGTYSGEWKDNFKDGRGEMVYKNGDTYDGNWSRGQFSGQGQYTEKQNCIYKGQFLNGKYHGQGEMLYKNGDKYEGQFQNGKKHGSGKYDWEDGDYYDGDWKFDSAEGHGTSMIGDDFYDGDFKNGRKHGQGEWTTGEGDIIRGMWQNNELIKKFQVNGQIVEDDD